MLLQRLPVVSLKLRESAFSISSLVESFIHHLHDSERMVADGDVCKLMK